MLKYHPYKSDKPNKKYYIFTNKNKKLCIFLQTRIKKFIWFGWGL